MPKPKDSARSRRTQTSSQAKLSDLLVIDELIVGPVQVEKRRLLAPYIVRCGRRKEQTELIYAWEEDVFDPNKLSDVNLAGMIAAQLALNYGLFCRRIVFRGAFDDIDKRFLTSMAQNTAREIYVKKFLEENPFLTGPVASQEPVRQKSYLAAELVFPDSKENELIRWSPHESRKDRVAVASSGGKDSLVSFGLLSDMGYDVHPIFGNESGRHWFTALNAYRYFQDSVPNTGRVWMNSDRVFAWMLRQFPFVRQDFATIRSDEYPIRLWTVALFVFGTLPLSQKRGIGRLVIGDEFDTTDRRTHKGIPHYNGLYDQSRYFDNALSRYYASKKWALSQFSIVRQMSEMLIEKVLVHRYGRLFRQQVSCHATHTDDGRVRPCGRCEKCRRIVGMVLAVNGDPTVCGYKTDQIESCLESLVEKGVHQESAGAAHLYWTLQEKGRIPVGGVQGARAHAEIMKLRFDPERAPADGIPLEMRTPLYRLLLEHANGAVRRQGKNWQKFDPLKDKVMSRPYVFERSKPAARRSTGSEAEKRRTYLLGEMTWPEARRRFEEVDVALLPVGAVEQHGPHLPLDTDSFDANYLAKAVAARCTRPRPIVLPLIPYGVSYHHDDFAGTISIRNETLARLVYEIGMSAARNGITKLVIINGHGGNDPALNFAAQEINRDAHIFACVDTGETSDIDVYGMIDTPNDVHAGEIETSTSLAVRPELVKMDRAEKLVPKFSSRYLDFTSKRGISWYAFTKKISESGVMGDPTKASAEKGRKMWDIMITHLVAFVEDLKKLTLDEIFQKRY